MFEEEQICPYTGLRSFTEEESLYFKGREDDIDQATQQLQRNKFLMLTGASGDGKSSLIYAGIIPNARAGFLKSKYTQWCVADFRPERTPFHNLCKSIARELEIESVHSVEAELNHGFSAIIDLYKNSKRYIDPGSDLWLSASDTGRAVMKREAANFIILVDQFEEFFTNPENYHKGVPSVEASLVLNLLLETARISLEEDLPVYIVFTMRSDYIGQCAAFRGLPEYIGFSQFFVPRLNRTQLQQVIEEPAILSGNRISRRLTERLIHDLTEGVDQLPILQHALNQVWHAADDGRDEMDLLHYAMVGGMPVDELPPEQAEQFNLWFEELPREIKACYHKPDLQNVLDTHTNKLYEQAAEYYREHTGKDISNEDAKSIIRTAFICLTKIDQSRAVRNRMTLREITDILHRPEFGTDDVGSVLNIFREPGNTFIRPFIQDDPATHRLNEDDVLDITHESLIRNWEYLHQWASEEYDNFTTSLDFEQQLNRWVESGKSKDFLLSIGPLTYFENWFNATKPNAYWIARYLPEDTEEDRKLGNATAILANSREFLHRSAQKHTVTRTIMRYGAKRIAVLLMVIAFLTLSSFVVRDYFRKQNDQVLKNFRSETFKLVNIPKLSPEFQVPVVTEQLVKGNLTIPEVIQAIKDRNQQINIATGIATQLVLQGRNEPQNEILQSLGIADSLLDRSGIPPNSQELSTRLKLLHDFSVTAGAALLFNQDSRLDTLVKRNAARSANLVMHIYRTQPADFENILYLGLALTNAINHKKFTSGDIDFLLKTLSPFGERLSTPWLEKNYHRDKVMVRGSQNYGPRFNGLYQDLAYLYAASGNAEGAARCLDTLLRYQDNFYQNDYSTHIENAYNIAGVFCTYDNPAMLDRFVKEYCTRKNITAVEFYNRMLAQSLPDDYISAATNFYIGGGGQVLFNMNLKYCSDEMLALLFNEHKTEILKITGNDERNFNLALSLKNEGVSFAARQKFRGVRDTGSARLYDDAIHYYNQVSRGYLNEPIQVIGTSSSDNITVQRKFLFLYPDYRVPFHPSEPRNYIEFYFTDTYIDHILKRGLFDSLYTEMADLKYFEPWLIDYQVGVCSRDIFMREAMNYTVMERLASKLEERNASQSVDLNILYLHLGEMAFNYQESDKGIKYLKQIRPDRLLNSFQFKTFNFVNTYSLELVGKAIANLSAHGQFDLAFDLVNVFKKEVNRSSLYAYASQLVSLKRQSPETAQRLLDSAKAEMSRLDNPAEFQPNRHQVAMALMYQDPGRNSAEAYRVIKNVSQKFEAMWRFSKAYAFHGNLYKARKEAPGMVSAVDRGGFLQSSIDGFLLNDSIKKEWEKFKNNELLFSRRFLPYVNEN